MKSIKAPKAEKLPSGSWRCRVVVDGDFKSFTGPIRSQVEEEALQFKLTHQSRPLTASTVGDAVDRYIRAREAVLSPATIRGYDIIRRNYFQRLMAFPLRTLRQSDCQEAIDREVGIRSPKSVKNGWALIRSSLQYAGTEDFKVALPQIPKPDTPWLDPDQIPTFLSAVQDHPIEVAALLGLHGLRNSEILDLTWNDVDLVRGIIHVRGAAVPGRDGKLVHKATNKTERSTRSVQIWLPRLQLLLQQNMCDDGYVCPIGERSAYFAINRICRKAGLPELGIHGLRRSYASLCYHLGIPERVTMQQGGWSDAATMHKHYVRVAERAQQDAVAALKDFAAGL